MLGFLIDTVYALPSQQAEGEGSFLIQLLPLLLIVVVFYFFIIRPQQKKSKAQRDMIGSLKKGDKVIINSGMFGTIKSISKDDAVISLEIADKTVVRVKKEFVISKTNDK